VTPDPHDPDGVTARARREPLLDAFELACKAGERPCIEDVLPLEAESARGALFRDLLAIELAYRRLRNETPTAAEYGARFPLFGAVVAALFEQTSPHAATKLNGTGGGRFRAGLRIADRYVIVARLGRGGMGEVYQVEDEALGQTVALKFLPEERTDETAWTERLKQEVTLARSVSHPHVCRVHDYQEADGYAFLVMEFAAGGSLVTQARLRPSGRFAPEDVNAYARQLCDGLSAVHDAGLLHRDLKPGNVLLDERGRVKLADFGLAAVAERVRSGEADHGTWQFMAPEQLDGGGPTVRSDLYALGLILYELLTGQRPYRASNRAELRQKQRTPPPRPSDLVPGVDPLFDRAILWCLERDPQRRPGSAREVRDALPPLAPAKTRDEGGSGVLRPRVALALLVAVLVGLLVHAALADATMAFRQLPPARDPNWLRGHSADLARSFSGVAGVTENSGFEWDLDLVKDASHKRPSAWHPEPDARSPLVYFWYRCGPVYLAPANRVTPTDPPLATPGMQCLLLDLEGRLIEYHAVPDRVPRATGERTREQWRTEWEVRLLRAAQLDPSRFQRSTAERRPPVFADDWWGLEEVGGTGKQVLIALCDARPVYFRVGEPFADGALRPDRTEGENVEVQAQRRLSSGQFGVVLVIVMILGSIPVAYRNWRLGRADLTGAVWVVVLFAGPAMISWVLVTDHVGSLHAERLLLMNVLGVTAFWSAGGFVCYLTVEPFMRRRWPERLSSWNRVLGGRLLDPLVGRDVLIGVLAGVVSTLILKALAAVLGRYFLVAPVYDPFTPNVPFGFAFFLFSYALVRTTAMFVLLLLLGLLLRSERLVLLVLVPVLAYFGGSTLVTFPRDSWVAWAGMALYAWVGAIAAIRFGWVALLVAVFCGSVLTIWPVTFGPHAWYAGATLTAAVTILALAGYGFRVSLGGQRLLPDDL
jgi:serine/threonine-protein kinase